MLKLLNSLSKWANDLSKKAENLGASSYYVLTDEDGRQYIGVTKTNGYRRLSNKGG